MRNGAVLSLSTTTESGSERSCEKAHMFPLKCTNHLLNRDQSVTAHHHRELDCSFVFACSRHRTLSKRCATAAFCNRQQRQERIGTVVASITKFFQRSFVKLGEGQPLLEEHIGKRLALERLANQHCVWDESDQTNSPASRACVWTQMIYQRANDRQLHLTEMQIKLVAESSF